MPQLFRLALVEISLHALAYCGMRLAIVNWPLPLQDEGYLALVAARCQATRERPGLALPVHEKESTPKKVSVKRSYNGLLMSFYALAAVLAYLLQLLVVLLTLQGCLGYSPAQSGVLAAPFAAKLDRNAN